MTCEQDAASLRSVGIAGAATDCNDAALETRVETKLTGPGNRFRTFGARIEIDFAHAFLGDRLEDLHNPLRL